jgi:hypothetical protein
MGKASCPRLLPFYTTYYLTGTEGQPEEEKSYSHLSMLIFRLEKTASFSFANAGLTEKYNPDSRSLKRKRLKPEHNSINLSFFKSDQKSTHPSFC